MPTVEMQGNAPANCLQSSKNAEYCPCKNTDRDDSTQSVHLSSRIDSSQEKIPFTVTLLALPLQGVDNEAAALHRKSSASLSPFHLVS